MANVVPKICIAYVIVFVSGFSVCTSSGNAQFDLFASYRNTSVKDSSGNAIPPSRIDDLPDRFFRWQQTPKETDGKIQQVKISTFQYKTLTTSEQFVVEAGGVAYARETDAFSTRGSGEFITLEKNTVLELNILFSKLPASTITPPLDHLICISFKDQKDTRIWLTYTYDLNVVPEELNKILHLSGFYRVTSYGKSKFNQKPPKQRTRSNRF